MSITIQIREGVGEPQEVAVSRVPVPYEFIDIGGVEWQAVKVKHFTNTVHGDVQAEVGVLKAGETT